MVMVKDDGGEEEQHQVVDAKGYFIPHRPRPGD
jgi:hypothetical protein